MNYKENEEKMLIDTPQIDEEVTKYVKIISDLIGFDLSQYNVSNIYALNVILANPSNFISDPDVCNKIHDLKELMNLMEGLSDVR